MENPLDDFGDRRAPLGSEAWAKSWRLQLGGLLKTADSDVEGIQTMLTIGRKFEAWKLLRDPDGKPFASLWSFCETAEPYGCGVPASKVRALFEASIGKTSTAAIATRPEAAPDPGGKRPGAGRPAKGEARKNHPDNDKAESKYGTDPGYLAARIARDAPEVLEDMKAGKYPSVRAAAKAAGIVKDRDPVRVAATAMAKVPVNRLAELVRAMPEQTRRMLTTCLRDAS